MVLGYHIILSAYGFWLPNDPRGSWSETIRVYELLQFGPATKVKTTRSVAHTPPSPLARNHWSPFIDSPEYLEKAINYVNDNPVRTGLKRRRWHCVTELA
jgi:hypothetical protein